MTIEEVHPSEPDWIGRADVELVTIVSELPHLAALALRAWGTVNYKNFRALRDVLRSLCPVALELRCLRSIPPQLFAGARALRLDRVHIDRQAAQCICAPVALELCSILQNDFAALQLDVRKLTRLRLDGVPIEAGELMARSATTLQMLEVGTSIPAPQAPLPALRVLALRDLESVRQWLRAAPGTRHLIVHIALQVRLAVSKESGDLVAWSASTVPRGVMLDADTIAEGKALEVVTVVTYSGQVDKRQWQDVAVSRRYGENNVEIRCMRIPQSRVAPMISRPSLVDPDILDENWV
ncbi:hypothetical protein BD626DRAFT_564175 [Schizophyllum amplum]|uniref:F-box domain-containing protein n=1 Tax=Schizophyllum amplum TaxID=97359 RepID=A0A550D0J3_9AGAR|nr:hypothetical protein BD626DRAFT_564175 [Auriculariopsis ampla]